MTSRILPETTTVRSLGGPLAAGRHAHRLALLRAGLLTLASVVAVAAFGADASAATVATDQPDYHVGQTVAITEAGREVLAGGRDRVACGIDRWLGGVHVRSGAGIWRWDDERQRMTKR